MMYRYYLFLTATLLFCVSLNSTSVAQRVLSKPVDYIFPTGVVVGKDATKTGSGGGNDWIAFSDRGDNPTYTTSSGISPDKTMKFMEAFYVVEETDTYVHIYKYDISAIRNPRTRALSTSAIDYGWAPKDKMLLWRNSLVNPVSKFTIKALMVNKPESLKNPEKYVLKDKKLRLFNSPKLEANSENSNDVRLFQFLFVFKEDKENNSILIGKSDDLFPNSPEKYMLGWLSKDIVQIWEQRMAIEPNWDEKAVEERTNRNVKASVMDSESSARAMNTGNTISNEQILWNKDSYTKRNPPEWKRLPVLGTLPDNLVKTGVVTDIFDKSGQVVIKSDEYLKISEKYNQIRDKFRKVNVVYVIDGTSSMAPYFGAVISGLRSMTSLLSESRNNYKFGAVVYRDYAEERCPQGNKLINSEALTSSVDNVIRFLEKMTLEAKDCMDKDVPEAMYHGLEKALRMMNAEETNIIVLVGDAGNHQNDPRHTPKEIINLLTEKECSILAYQVRNGNHPAFNDFIAQTSELIRESSKKISAQINKNSSTQIKQDSSKNLLNPKFEPKNSNTYRLNFPKYSPIPGTIIFSNPGGEIMSVTALEKELNLLLRDLENQHEDILAQVDSKLSAIGGRYTMNAAVYRLISKVVPEEKLLSQLSFENFQFFAEGYASINVKALNYPIYQYVLFIDNSELELLKVNLEKLWKGGGTGSQIRAHLVNVYKEILSEHYGSREARRILNETTPSQVMQLITGLPAQSSLLSKYTIADLEDQRRVSDTTIEEIINNIRDKYEQLQKVAGNPDFFFREFDNSYYWIPQNMLP